MKKTMTLGELNRVYGGTEIDHKLKADDDLGFYFQEPVLWTKHPEYDWGLYLFGGFGYGFVIFDERKAHMKGCFVPLDELVS